MCFGVDQHDVTYRTAVLLVLLEPQDVVDLQVKPLETFDLVVS